VIFKRKTIEKTVEKILQEIIRNPKITQKELERITGLSRRGIEWNLTKMKEKKLIRRIGSDRSGYWKILN
jgi:ATP-dependent DNA helicase RecG